MYAVAIRALNGSIDEEAASLARELGIAPYDARLKLSQPAPMIVMRTNDMEAARALGVSLHARGHDVVAIDEGAVPEPVSVRAFRFDDAAFESNSDAIAYGDIVALVRAVRTTRSESTEKVTERKLRPGMAIATGGLIMSKKVTREVKHVGQDREDLLYVFARSRPAWLVGERTTQYGSLDAVATSQRENFLRVVDELRKRAPQARLDERLLAHKTLDALSDITLRAQILAMKKN